MTRLSLVFLLALLGCERPAPAPGAPFRDTIPPAPSPTLGHPADGEVMAALPAGVALDPAAALLGAWECPTGVPAMRLTFDRAADGTATYTATDAVGGVQTGTWTLGPGRLALVGARGEAVYTGVAVGPDDFAGRAKGTLFTCTRPPR